MPPSAFRSGETLAGVLHGVRTALPRLELRMLVQHVMQLSHVQLLTQSERTLTDEEAARLNELVARRIAGEPVAYLIGEREFFGLPFGVNASVLIPRPETELLVELAMERLPQGGHVLDMGTGSGAIAVAIAHTRPDASVAALDISEEALAVARKNAEHNRCSVRFCQSDWFSALQADERFDLIVSNPPYIVAGDTHLSEGDLRFEPVDALTDHADGLSALRTLCRHAGDYLQANGWLLMEHGYDQSAAVRQLLTAAGFEEVQSWQDLAGIERVSGGRKR